MSLSLAVSPSFCSLRISSGLLYGLRASRCVTLSLSGRSCTSPTFFLFEAKARFFGLDTAAPFVMLLRRGREECRGLVRPASAGAGARTVTFLPVREQETQHQKQHCYIKNKKYLQRRSCRCWHEPASSFHHQNVKLLCATVFAFIVKMVPLKVLGCTSQLWTCETKALLLWCQHQRKRILPVAAKRKDLISPLQKPTVGLREHISVSKNC